MNPKVIMSLARKFNVNPKKVVKFVDNIMADPGAWPYKEPTALAKKAQDIIKKSSHFVGKTDETLPFAEFKSYDKLEDALTFEKDFMPKGMLKNFEDAREMVRSHFKTPES